MRLLQEFKIMVRKDYPAHPPKLFFTHDVNNLLSEEYVEIWIKTIPRLYAFIYEYIRLMVS
jgi:ubiquitin-protein ligase